MMDCRYMNDLLNAEACKSKNTEECKRCKFCYTSTEASIHSRRCFMTGEYCSKQTNIHREQQQMHGKNHITAFVIMNFSDMSDVVYKWRIKAFIESLSKYLYFDEQKERLYCSTHEVSEEKRVKEIRVIRSDTAPSSNYVICSRICQQMQIADLVVVDVSAKNANVFYEFGMAIALGKLILPICYSESFYKMTIPAKIKDELDSIKEVEHHIGCYPWRKDLFEFYGIRYKYKDSKTRYEDFERATNIKYGFSDVNYTCFPYHEPLPEESEIVGEKIYNRLRHEYNKAGYEQNTLVVYTMDAFLNEGQAGLCIVNFYHGITARMRQEKCFCGERIGVLVQENTVWEEEKDAKGQLDLSYNVGEIIQIGLNQATYLAMKDKIGARDSFVTTGKDAPSKEHRTEMERFIKGYVRNKGMRIYPNYPVFVDRMKNLHYRNILDPVYTDPNRVCTCFNGDFFCLYHVMLRTLRYTNEVVVDISGNNLQALFWLGAAHGSDIHAITVIHEKTSGEKGNDKEHSPRYIFDVAGLWTAIFRKNDTEGFYQQLALAQHGIERQSKLMLADNEIYKNQLDEYFSSFNREHDEGTLKALETQKKAEEELVLESYYRTRFWTPMLSYNQLSIYISHRNKKDGNGEPRVNTTKWDFDAIAELSNYLSKRKIIGQYKLRTLDETGADKIPSSGAKQTNFICVGSLVKPLGEKGSWVGIPDYIAQKIPKRSRIHSWVAKDVKHLNIGKDSSAQLKGFACIDNEDMGYYTHIPQTQLEGFYQEHSMHSDIKPEIIYSVSKAKESDFVLDIAGTHYEIAQLILWREDLTTPDDYSHYWVSIAGNSGPATLALSTVLIDEAQRKEVFFAQETASSSVNLLCALQAEVRKQFMEHFLHNLNDKMRGIAQNGGWDFENQQTRDQMEAYFKLVEYSVSFYLQTVLYRYFFPFLTQDDMERIRNGMYTMINSMQTAKVSPFVLNYATIRENRFAPIHNDIVNGVVEQIPKVLFSALQNFRGLEAFYLVEVEHCLNDEKDTRKIKSIKMMRAANEASQIVNCFMLD